jgi:hypothetical protein
MKPILSRFCEIYVPEPVVKNVTINLYKYNIESTFNMKDHKIKRLELLKKDLLKLTKNLITQEELMNYCTKLYEKGYSGLDILHLIENQNFLENIITNEKRYEMLICFNNARKEFRNEKLLMLFVLNFIFYDKKTSLENINFM